MAKVPPPINPVPVAPTLDAVPFIPNALKNIKVSEKGITRPKRKISKPSGRASLQVQEFDNVLEDQGCLVKITPSVLCPNRSAIGDTNHALDCPVCFGAQIIDLDALAVQDWAYIKGVNFDQEFQVQGIYEIRDARITTKQGVRLFYWYKIEVIDFASVYNQLIKRSESTDFDQIRYNPATVVDTPYALRDSAGVDYVLNKDYKLTTNRTIQWTGTKRPAPGTLYTFLYPIYPTFRVLDLVHENRYYYADFKRPDKVPVQLPQEAVIRWDYLAIKSERNTVAEPTK